MPIQTIGQRFPRFTIAFEGLVWDGQKLVGDAKQAALFASQGAAHEAIGKIIPAVMEDVEVERITVPATFLVRRLASTSIEDVFTYLAKATMLTLHPDVKVPPGVSVLDYGTVWFEPEQITLRCLLLHDADFAVRLLPNGNLLCPSDVAEKIRKLLPQETNDWPWISEGQARTIAINLGVFDFDSKELNASEQDVQTLAAFCQAGGFLVTPDTKLGLDELLNP
ncbi:MAG: hypothetical protein WCI73_12410 [Phycisphaerae bacterium]